jgi:hypothetical protein
LYPDQAICALLLSFVHLIAEAHLVHWACNPELVWKKIKFLKNILVYLRIIAHLTSLCTKAIKVYRTTMSEVHSKGFQECSHKKTKEGNKQLERRLFTWEVPNPNVISPRFPHHRSSPPPTSHTQSCVPIGKHPRPWASIV